MFKDMAYFDKQGNEPGNLCSKLDNDCHIINLLVGTYMGVIINSLCSLFVGIFIAFIASWRIALISLALSPILMLAGYIE